MTLWEAFLFRWGYNGRIVTDVFANIWYRFPSMMWWKYFDTGIYKANSVRAVRVEQYKPYFKTKEEIALFLDLHKYAVEHKDENETGMMTL